jgi:hypothetical protein
MGMTILKMVLERNPVGRVWTGILSAARSINNAAVLRDVTSSLVRRLRKFIQAAGGHFEQFA